MAATLRSLAPVDRFRLVSGSRMYTYVGPTGNHDEHKVSYLDHDGLVRETWMAGGVSVEPESAQQALW